MCICKFIPTRIYWIWLYIYYETSSELFSDYVYDKISTVNYSSLQFLEGNPGPNRSTRTPDENTSQGTSSSAYKINHETKTSELLKTSRRLKMKHDLDSISIRTSPIYRSFTVHLIDGNVFILNLSLKILRHRWQSTKMTKWFISDIPCPLRLPCK